MTSNKSAKPPTLVDGIDVRSLPIGPEEAFVLSRVDGNSSPGDIALATGLDEERVESALNRLTEIGAIVFQAAQSAKRDPQPAAQTARSKPEASARAFAHTVPAMAAVVMQKPPPYDPSELNEEADLPEETKHRVLETFYLLEELTHYELLRVTRDADKKTIKKSYYEVVNTFHPDRYFGKKLGSFKSKMEAVFARITVAHDTLTRLTPRQEYDEYLARQLKTRELDLVLEAEPPVELFVEARPPVGTVAERPEEQAMVASAPGDGMRTVQATRPTMRRASDPEVRRRALARKLRTSGSPGARISGTMKAVEIPVDKQALKKQVEHELKARYERAERAPVAQVEHYVKAAEQAVRDKDPLSAANALRIASQLAPDDDELRQRLAQAQEKAAADLADTYLEQAKYEEREGRQLKAAQSYERAALGKRSPALYEHAAICLLEGGGELKRAADLARKAVELAPDQPGYHVTLSRVYAAAKMLTSATTEAEKAVKLAPENESAKKWLKRVKRGEI